MWWTILITIAHLIAYLIVTVAVIIVGDDGGSGWIWIVVVHRCWSWMVQLLLLLLWSI